MIMGRSMRLIYTAQFCVYYKRVLQCRFQFVGRSLHFGLRSEQSTEEAGDECKDVWMYLRLLLKSLMHKVQSLCFLLWFNEDLIQQREKKQLSLPAAWQRQGQISTPLSLIYASAPR